MMELSEKFMFGMDVAQSDDSAAFWVNKAVATGDADALYLVGIQLVSEIYSSKNFGQGVKYLKDAGEKHHPDALLKLSKIYRTNGTSTENDRYFSKAKAFDFAKQAADAGNSEALVYCGLALLEGNGAQRNDSLAVVYLTEAAADREAAAQVKLGELYRTGAKSVGGRDIYKAIEYYEAARQNPYATLEDKTAATIGIHEVDRIVKRTQNLMIQAAGMVPEGAFRYPVSDK